MAERMATRVLHGVTERTSVIVVVGPLRYPAARALRAFVDGALCTEDVDAIAVDLRGATFVDSTGLGLLARIGRQSLAQHGRRAMLVCPDGDVALTLRSAAFDELCVMVDDAPYDGTPEMVELSLADTEPQKDSAMGRVILEAHRDLAAMSEKNRDEYAAVIAALEAELARGREARRS